MRPLKEILGKPGEGIHFHVFGVAIVDILLTIVAGCTLGWWVSRIDPEHPLPVWILMIIGVLLLFVMGELLHGIIGVETAFIKWLDKVLDID